MDTNYVLGSFWGISLAATADAADGRADAVRGERYRRAGQHRSVPAGAPNAGLDRQPREEGVRDVSRQIFRGLSSRPRPALANKTAIGADIGMSRFGLRMISLPCSS